MTGPSRVTQEVEANSFLFILTWPLVFQSSCMYTPRYVQARGQWVSLLSLSLFFGDRGQWTRPATSLELVEWARLSEPQELAYLLLHSTGNRVELLWVLFLM